MQRFWGSSSLFNNGSKDFDEIIRTTDLDDRLSTNEPGLRDFVITHLDALVRTATQIVPEETVKLVPDAATLFPRNATILLGVVPKYAPDATEAVVTATMRALATRSLHPVAAQNIQTILNRNSMHELGKTLTAAAKAAQDPEVFHNLIRHLAAHNVIGDLLLTLLGADAQSSALQALDELPHLKWGALGLPTHLAKYAQVALSSTAAPAYFNFLSRLFSQSLSSEIGPFVDDLLEHYDGGEDDVIVIVLGAAAAAAQATADGFPHLAEGLTAVSNLVTMVHRAAYDETQTPTDYRQKLRANKALACVLRKVAEVAPLLQSENLNSEFGRSRGTLGVIRMRLVEIFVSLYRLSREESDLVLKKCRFFEHLFALAEQYPEHDVLLNFVSDICCSATTREFDDKALLHHLMESCDLPKRMMRWNVSKGAGLRTVARQVARAVGQVRAYETSAPGVAASDWEDFLNRNHAAMQPWFEVITGDQFDAIGSAGLPPVVHRAADTSNERYASPTISMGPSYDGFGNTTEQQVEQQQHSYRDSRYSYYNHQEDNHSEGATMEQLDPDFHVPADTYLTTERPGLPAEDFVDSLHLGSGGDTSGARPISAGESEGDMVLGDDQWIERTIEDIEDATSPQPKNRASNFAVLEQWGDTSPSGAEFPGDGDKTAGGATAGGDEAGIELNLDDVETIPKAGSRPHSAGAPAGNNPSNSSGNEDEDW